YAEYGRQLTKFSIYTKGGDNMKNIRTHTVHPSTRFRDDEVAATFGPDNIIEIIVLVILVVVLVVVVTALLPTYNSSLTNYSTNSTSGLGGVVSSIGRLLLDVAVLLVVVIGLLAVAMKYGGRAGHKGL